MSQKRHKQSHNSLQVRLDDLLEYHPITKNQELTYDAWEDDYNLVLTGSAGTGKTFMGMYLGLEQVLDPDTEQDRLVIIRSMVPTRELGFLPGTKEEKEDVFTSPYKAIALSCLEIHNRGAELLQQRKFNLNLHLLSVDLL